MSMSLVRPVDQVKMPASGFVAMSVKRKDEERLMHCLRTFWSTVSGESLWREWARESITKVEKSVLGG